MAFIAVLALVLVFYFLSLGRRAVFLLTTDDPGYDKPLFKALAVGLLILPLLGVWMLVTSLRAAFDHQRLARRMHEEGRELDVSQLPRRASGRIEKAAADALFEQVKQEFEADPENWRSNYRAARAYDYAGDRTRAREMMKRAVELERAERSGKQ
ncbi:hypothetical protein KP696_03100 [Nocardia seriolae]|nr:hypothetical protein [Nocardia seriolae]MTJ64925.1 hypothetical protein [Nocardia seriolae]MTJ70951.1 hypothetical protein [Nocardia seriolae]MTJ89742.1 hypothetical protein [Nocardia seriolae]MTK33717.1 hypothetical protein [Nocardia seriolae]MTK42870.1 hypothetical protein [Nocardia seriolae]